MISIFKRLWSKKWVIISCVVIILAGYGISLASRGEIYEWFTWHTGRGEFFFHNVNEIDKDLMERFCSLLEIGKSPESAEDIYLYYAGAVSDKTVFCSMTLSAEEVPKFAKYFIGVPISAFKEEGFFPIPGLQIFGVFII